jgi:hypothetical protein
MEGTTNHHLLEPFESSQKIYITKKLNWILATSKPEDIKDSNDQSYGSEVPLLL